MQHMDFIVKYVKKLECNNTKLYNLSDTSEILCI